MLWFALIVTIKEEMVGHVQQNISMIVSMFLSLFRCALDIFANVKRVCHGCEYGLEIPANISLCEPENVNILAKNKITMIEENFNETRKL